MTTPLQSPEYAALVAAKEAHSAAVAKHIRAKDELLFVALNEGCSASFDDLRELALGANLAEYEADAAVATAQAAFDAAYPAPADVVAAVEAVKIASIAHDTAHEAFSDSLTPEQEALNETIEATQTALDAAVTHAKALIEAAQVSPSRGFVVKRSVKAIAALSQLINAEVWSAIKVDTTALGKWCADNPDKAAEIGISAKDDVSVAFYAAKL